MSKYSNMKKLDSIRSRVNDIERCNGEAIKNGDFIHFTGHIILEMKWLVKELDRLIAREPSSDSEKEEADEPILV